MTGMLGSGMTKLWNNKRWLLLLAVVVLAGNAMRLAAVRFFPRIHHSSSTVLQPYTARLKAVLRNADGTETVKWFETYSLRQDGSIVRKEEGLRASGPYIYRDVYLRTGQHISTDDVAELKNTGAIGSSWRYVRDPASQCLQTMEGEAVSDSERVVGLETFIGHHAVRIHQRLSTDLYALDLSCALLYAKSNQPGNTVMSKELVELAPGPPDTTLFDIPGYFREVPVTELGGVR